MILSPTPPVECLSEVVRDSEEKSIRSPEAIIAWVQCAISSGPMSLRKIAMASAAICSSATTPRVYASMTQSIWSFGNGFPSRLVAMTSTASNASTVTWSSGRG